MTKKIAVIGAGIAGTTTAYSLAKQGMDVTLIDSRRYPAMATSYANGGQLSASNSEVWNTPKNILNGIKWMFKKDAPLLFNPSPSIQKYKWIMGFLVATFDGKHKIKTQQTIDLAKRAREIYFEIAVKEGIDFDLLKEGILHFYDSDKELKVAASKASWLHQEGMEWEVLSRDEVEDLEPAFKSSKNDKKIVGGIYTKSDASGDIHKFCKNMHRVLEDKYGVKSLFNTEIETIYKDKDKVILAAADESSASGMQFDQVAICAGIETQRFADVLGDSMRVYPVKGYSITIQLDDEESQTSAPKVSLLDDPKKIVSSRLGNRLRVAGTAELAGTNKDIKQDRIRPLLGWVRDYFPGVSTENYTPWAGLRPMTPDMMPLIFESKAKDIFYNTGHGHLGWTLGAATGDLLAEKMINE
jgi:D-amino-acid dehydrogenase